MAGFSNLLETKGRRGIVQGVPASFNVHLGLDRPVETLADTFAVNAEASLRLVLARNTRTRRGPTWDCGQRGLTPQMEYTATGFSKPIRMIFKALFRPRREVQRESDIPARSRGQPIQLASAPIALRAQARQRCAKEAAGCRAEFRFRASALPRTGRRTS